ncbi:MAG: hypothetical protein ACTHOL_18575 [Luteibacter jiangsuensis]
MAKPATADLMKSAASIAADLLPSGVTTAFGLLRQGAGALASYVERLNQHRFEEFCEAAYEAEVFPENAEDLTVEELLVMLRLCLADIEDEKAALYGRLASSIAAGRVPQDLRHALMTSLAAITLAQAERLRKAHIAHEHALIPDVGAGRRGQAEYLIGAGPAAQWDVSKLESVTLVRGNALTDMGHRLVEACYRASDLSPDSIGARRWRSDEALGIYCYELDDPDLRSLAEAIGREARRLGWKVTPAMAPQVAQRGHALRSVLPVFLVLVKSEPQRVIDHLDLIMPGQGRTYVPVIVSVGDMAESLKLAFSTATFVAVTSSGSASAEEVLAQTMEAMDRRGST